MKHEQALLEACQQMYAISLLGGEPARGGDQPDKRSDLESVFSVACSFWQQDRREEAAHTFRDLLTWDRDDRQFARYWLAATFLDLRRHDELQRVLKEHEEPTAAWRYAQTLLAFRLTGDSDDARRLLEEAQSLDPHFLDYLLGDALVHADRPIRFGREPRESTHSLARLFLPAWRSTPEAAAWARKVLRIPLGDPPAGMPFPREELRSLPRHSVTWQVGLRLLDEVEPDSGQPPVWILGIANVDDRKLLYMTVIEEEPVPAAVWREILSAFRQPLDSPPHRPAKLVVPRVRFFRAWHSMLTEIGVTCVFEDDPQPIGELVGGMAELIKLQRLPRRASHVDPSEFASVIYDEVAVMAPADLDLVERNGWPVPTPEAYPVALRFEPGRQPQSPSGQDLEYIDSCLQTIPDFVRRGVDAKTYEVETNGERVKLRLCWTASTTP